MSHPGQLWYLLVPASPCKTAIMRRLTLHGVVLWFTYSMLWSRVERLRTADSDVVILVVVLLELIATQPLADIWVAFGMGKN